MKNIQLIAPGSYVPNLNSVQLKHLEEQFKKIGYQLCYSDNLFKKKYFWAGSVNVRQKDIENAFLNPKIDAVLAIRGGGGSMWLLDKINYQRIKAHPKPFIAFSDITALQNALWAKIGLPSYTGFVGSFGFQKIPAKTLRNLKLTLENKTQKIPFKTIHKGKAEGILLGGNLTTLCALMGTPYLPNFNRNILLLEEVGEPAYHLDRLFNQLRLSGIFDKISGLILGDLTANLKPQDKFLANKIIKEYLTDIKCPVIQIKGYSHHYKSTILPLGVKIRIDTSKDILCLDKVKKFH